MSKSADTSLTIGRLSVLFQAQLRLDSMAAAAWSAHKAEEEWDHVAEHALSGAVASAASRAKAFGQQPTTVAFRHVKGGVADVTAAASQLMSKEGALKVLVAYVGGPGQAADAAELGAALSGAVTGSAELGVIVGTWTASLGHYRAWDKVFQAFVVRGPEAEAGEERPPHPVLDRLAPQPAELTAG